MRPLQDFELFRNRHDVDFIWSLRKSRKTENPHGCGFSRGLGGGVSINEPRLGRRSVALFKFLSASTRTQFVASNFGLIALHGLGRRLVVLVGMELLRPAVGSGHGPEKLFDFLRREAALLRRLRKNFARRNRLELRS